MKRLAFVPGLHRATHRVGLYLRSRVPEVSQAEGHLLTHLHECGGAATVADLHNNGRLFPPNYLHESWMDYLYWDSELEP